MNATIVRIALTLLTLLCTIPHALASTGLPGDHEHWMGTHEEESGKGTIYDFRFQAGGDVVVEKSTGTKLLKQTFKWSTTNGAVRLSGDTSGPISELSAATLENAGRHFVMEVSPGERINVRRSIGVLSWIHLAFLFALLFAGNELCRRYKIAPYVVFFVLPIALIPLFLHSGFDGVFRWTKLYSAVVGAAFFTLFRFNGLHRFTWAKVTVAAILAVNILEACIQDFSTGQLPNILNATAGVLNILTISLWMGLRRDDQPPHDMLWPGMTLGWILAYDLWNVTIVYLNFPNTAAFTAMAVLLAPTLAAIFVKKGTWMQARAYTLAIYMIYIFSFKAFADNYLDLQFTVPLPRNDAIVMGLAVLSLAANIAYAVLHFRWRFTGKAPASIQVGQNPSVI